MAETDAGSQLFLLEDELQALLRRPRELLGADDGQALFLPDLNACSLFVQQAVPRLTPRASQGRRIEHW